MIIFPDLLNGPLEGHVNRLKLLKRSMYGRANFDLLKRRVLHHRKKRHIFADREEDENRLFRAEATIGCDCQRKPPGVSPGSRPGLSFHCKGWAEAALAPSAVTCLL